MSDETVPVPRELVEALREICAEGNEHLPSDEGGCPCPGCECIRRASALVDAVSEREDEPRIVKAADHENDWTATIEKIPVAHSSFGAASPNEIHGGEPDGCPKCEPPSSPNSEASGELHGFHGANGCGKCVETGWQSPDSLPRVARSLADLRVGQWVCCWMRVYTTDARTGRETWHWSAFEITKGQLNANWDDQDWSRVVILQDADPPAVDPAVLPTEPLTPYEAFDQWDEDHPAPIPTARHIRRAAFLAGFAAGSEGSN